MRPIQGGRIEAKTFLPNCIVCFALSLRIVRSPNSSTARRQPRCRRVLAVPEKARYAPLSCSPMVPFTLVLLPSVARGLRGLHRDGEALADEGPLGPRAPRALGRERGQGVDLCAQRESKHRTSRNFKGFQSFAKVLHRFDTVLECFDSFELCSTSSRVLRAGVRNRRNS